MNRLYAGLCHLALWAFLFLSPLTFWRGTGIKFLQYLMYCMQPLMIMIVFYLNYLYLAPKFFVAGKHRYDLLINLVLVIVLGIFLHSWSDYTNSIYVIPNLRHLDFYDDLARILRESINLAIFAVAATALALARRWVTADQKLKESEAARAKAELYNLRSQINPHFLLNTLNNIYALTAFDQTRAQNAIQQLSRMMRHMLYDNQEEKAILKDEIEFLENYVSLMKIRMSQNVEVTLEEDVENPHVKIAPLLFISLVENAFKHGVSPIASSFIHIKLTQKNDELVFVIENTHHPKDTKDCSGHGIGLQQVQRRLELAYAGRYEWTKGTTEDGKNYISTIKIQL